MQRTAYDPLKRQMNGGVDHLLRCLLCYLVQERRGDETVLLIEGEILLADQGIDEQIKESVFGKFGPCRPNRRRSFRADAWLEARNSSRFNRA